MSDKPKKNVLYTLYKPSGEEVRVNESSLAHAKELGWVKEAPKKAK